MKFHAGARFCLSPRSLRFKQQGPGFTLFEVLITLSILGVILSLLYMTFHQSMIVLAETEERAEVVQQGRLILERIAADLGGAVLFPRKEGARGFQCGFIGRSEKEGNDFLDRVDFTTLNSVPPGEPGWGVGEVGYFLDRQPGAKGLTLFRRQDDAMDGNLVQGGRTLALCERVRSLGFTFFDRQGREARNWNSMEGERKNQLPSRVEIHLKVEDSRSVVHDFRTQVFLPSAN